MTLKIDISNYRALVTGVSGGIGAAARMLCHSSLYEEVTLAARFIPVLYIEDEAQWVARLLELGTATHAHDLQEDRVAGARI